MHVPRPTTPRRSPAARYDRAGDIPRLLKIPLAEGNLMHQVGDENSADEHAQGQRE